MNRVERELVKRLVALNEGDELGPLSEITPGVRVDVHHKGKRIARVDAGKVYPYYDLASLTKILFAASVSIHYFSHNKRALNRSISEVLPWWKRDTTPARLLSHTAGLEWWLPMYKKLKGPLDPE